MELEGRNSESTDARRDIQGTVCSHPYYNDQHHKGLECSMHLDKRSQQDNGYIVRPL